MGLFRSVVNFFTGTEDVKVRNRDKKGKYVADDKSTPNKNEAYKTVRRKKAASKKKTVAKKKKPTK
tara:strand:+ start:632 stop:829 length:198 start_codon:yes stop_codon:yes gene_type:complete